MTWGIVYRCINLLQHGLCNFHGRATELPVKVKEKHYQTLHSFGFHPISEFSLEELHMQKIRLTNAVEWVIVKKLRTFLARLV